MSMKALCVKNLVKHYGHKKILDNVNLTLDEGEFYALMGPNGSGKTTLVSIVASVIPADEGSVRIYGQDHGKSLVSYVPQEHFSSPLLTGRETLCYFAQLQGFSRQNARSLTEPILETVGLSDEANNRVATYSGGMRKRLEVGTCLFPGTKLVILDEPTTGLDPVARREFYRMISTVSEEGKTILLITHIGEDAELAHTVGFIHEGTIIAQGSPYQLKKQSNLHQVVTVEPTVPSEHVASILSSFSVSEQILETESGFRLYCNDAKTTIPKVMRALESQRIHLSTCTVEVPSLEDVFFTLTRRQVSV
ncbi:MAG: ABC transporter ATP-binding protein [Theionarchaea archaeon]|nr:ABC transporter ATP-binding protein [Theionarchaea archaeon]